MNKIREVKIEKDKNMEYKNVRILFGPHYFAELEVNDNRLTFILGATHHGFKADASEVGGELEKFINEIRNNHQENLID